MRIFALELNHDIKGIEQRKEYIESLFVMRSDTIRGIKAYEAERKRWNGKG